MTWSLWRNFLNIEPTRILLQKARRPRSAKRYARDAEPLLAHCYSIVLTAIFVGNVCLLLPMGKVSRARHRWNWLRVMRAWWNCLQISVARSMR